MQQIEIAKSEDVQENRVLLAQVADTPVLLTRVDGKPHAFSNIWI